MVYFVLHIFKVILCGDRGILYPFKCVFSDFAVVFFFFFYVKFHLISKPFFYTKYLFEIVFAGRKLTMVITYYLVLMKNY